MKHFQEWFISIAVLLAGMLASCSSPARTPEVSSSIRKSLDEANLKGVSVGQDRDRGVVTLTGHVPSDDDKSQAESIARSQAAGQVVSDQIVVTPPGAENNARTITSDLDKAIEKNLDAVLIQQGVHDYVRYSVTTGVVTLTGNVRSQAARSQIQNVAASVPNVQQVVNEIQVANQPASSSR